MGLDLRHIQYIVMELLTVQMALNSQYAILEGRTVKPFLKAGNIIGAGFGFSVDTDDIQPSDYLLIDIIMHDIVLEPLIEDEIQGCRIAAIHGDNQDYLVVFAHGIIQIVNIIGSVFALLLKTLVAAVGTGVYLDIPKENDLVGG